MAYQMDHSVSAFIQFNAVTLDLQLATQLRDVPRESSLLFTTHPLLGMGRAKHLDCDNAICDRTGATFLENLWIIDWNIFKRDGLGDVDME